MRKDDFYIIILVAICSLAIFSLPIYATIHLESLKKSIGCDYSKLGDCSCNQLFQWYDSGYGLILVLEQMKLKSCEI